LQEEQLRAVRQCLEDALQLMSRVGCLGPIEAFFTADDLLSHYQRRLDVTLGLGKQLQQQRQQVRCMCRLNQQNDAVNHTRQELL
jgi:hypothetical protein